MSRTYTKFRLDTGEIIGWCSGEDEAPGPDYVLSPPARPGSAERQYVANGVLWDYTPEELAAKAAMPPGWTWLLPDRVAVDLRTPEQRDLDAKEAVASARRGAYPPLADLADALYWQSQGDLTKMNAYVEACAAVKARFPKPVEEG